MVQAVRDYIAESFLKTSRRLARVYGAYPLGALKIYSKNGEFVFTTFANSKDGEGFYGEGKDAEGKALAAGTEYVNPLVKMRMDVKAMPDDDKCVGVIYSVPYLDPDPEVNRIGDTFIVGYHMKNGETEQATMYCSTTKLGKDETSLRHIATVKDIYYTEFALTRGIGNMSPPEKELADAKFAEHWGGIEPHFIALDLGLTWGDVFLSRIVVDNPWRLNG